MRWPFRRQAPADASPDGAAPTPAHASAAERGPEAWRELEPLRTIEPVELTADGRRFAQGLGVRHPVELALQPLGHDLALEAPQGIVSGIAHAVAAPDRGLELPLVPPPRPDAPPVPVARARRPVQTAPAATAAPPASPPYVPPSAAPAPAAEPEASAPELPVDAPAQVWPGTVETPTPVRQLAAMPLPAARSASARGSELPVVPRAVQAVVGVGSSAPTVSAPSAAPAPLVSPPPRAAEQPSVPEAPVEESVVLAAELVEQSELPVRQPESAPLPTLGLRHEPTFETPLPPAPASRAPTAPPVSDTPDNAPPVFRRPGLGAPILRGPESDLAGPPPTAPSLARVEPVPPTPSRPVPPRVAQREVAPPVRPVQRAVASEPAAPASEPAPSVRAPDSQPVVPSSVVDQPAPAMPAQRPEEAPLVGAADIRQSDTSAPWSTLSFVRAEEGARALEPPVQPIRRPLAPVPPASPDSPVSAGSPPAAPPPVAPAIPMTRPLPSRAVQREAAPAPVARSVAPAPSSPMPSSERTPALATSGARAGAAPSAALPVRPLVGLHALAPDRADTPTDQVNPPAPSPAEAPVVRRLAALPDAASTLAATPAALPLAAVAAAMGVAPVPAAASAPPMPWPAPMRAAPAPPAPAPEPPAPQPAPAPAPARNGSAPPRRAVQRAVQIPELQVTPSPGASPAGGASAAQSPEQLREQVIRWIRAELLVNRERAGRLTDLR